MLTIIGVITTSSRPGSRAGVSYIDIKDFVEPSQKLIPVMSSPAPQNILPKPVQTPIDDPNDAVNSSNKDTTANSATDNLASTLELGMTNGYLSSLAEGRTLRDDIRGYYFVILEMINRKWWQKSGTLTEVAQQDGIIEVMIDREGKLVDLRLRRSTGTRLVDLLIIEAINEAAPFPSLPDSYEMAFFRAPLKISKPSYLFGTRKSPS